MVMVASSAAAAQEGRISIPGVPAELPITGICERSTAGPLDGSLVVVDKFEGTISVVDLPTGERVAQIPVGHGPHELAVSPDERRALVCNYGFTALSNSLSLVDLETLETIETFEFEHVRRPHDVWWTDDRVLITSEGTNSVIEVDPRDGRTLREYGVGAPTAHMLALNSDQTALYTANIVDSSVTRVDLRADTPDAHEVVKIGGAGEGICLSPDDGELWITDGQLDTIRVLDPDSLEVTHEIPCAGRPHRVRFSLDGETAIVSCLGSNEIVLVDVDQKAEAARIPNSPDAVVAIEPTLLGMPAGSCLPSAIRVHPDGVHALIANINSNTVTVVDLNARKTVGVLRCGFGADGMAITTRRFGPYAKQAGSDE